MVKGGPLIFRRASWRVSVKERSKAEANPSCLTPDPTPPPHLQFFKRMKGVALAELRFIPAFSLAETPSLSQNGS